MANPCTPRLLHTQDPQFTAPISEIYPDYKSGLHFALTFLETVACHVTRDKWNPEFEREREEIVEEREGGRMGEDAREERGVAH
jgi:hypothetical protein